MIKRIMFRHMDHSDVMQEYANGQLAKIEEFLSHGRDPIYVDLVLEPSKVHAHHRIELRIKTPKYEKFCDYEGPKFYDVLDHVIDTMYRMLLEEKRKQEDHVKDLGRHEEFKKQR
jgi:ribosomal subunit interface protein